MSNTPTFFDPSHKPRKAFRRSLKREVLSTYYGEEKKEMKSFIKNPFVVITGGAFAAIVIAVLAMVFVLDRGKQPNQSIANDTAQQTALTAVTVDPEYDSSAGSDGGAATMSMTLQAEEMKSKTYQTVDEAAQAVGFEPLVLGAAVDGEQLTEIFNFPNLGGTLPSIHFTYGDAATKRYEIIQTELDGPQDPLPEGVETVELNAMGKSVTAIHNVFWDENTPEAEMYPGSPRQSISFTVNGLSVDISDYSGMSLDQLKAVAANLQEN